MEDGDDDAELMAAVAASKGLYTSGGRDGQPSSQMPEDSYQEGTIHFTVSAIPLLPCAFSMGIPAGSSAVFPGSLLLRMTSKDKLA